MNVEVTRAVFEGLIDHLIERTLDTCADVLQEAGLGWSGIGKILLVGGSSQLPRVAQRLEQISGKKPVMPPSPLMLVAQGAALHAAFRTDRERLADEAAFKIVNVNAHTLGISSFKPGSLEPINTVLIPRNTPLPTKGQHTFQTLRDNQRNVAATVLEGESEDPRFCTPIGKCTVQLEPGLPKGTDVEVSCHYKTDGLIYVAARIPATKESAQVELRREQNDELESLSVWQRWLTVGGAPDAAEGADVVVPEPADEPVEDDASLEHLVRRLDFLHTQVGKRAADAVLTANVLPVQRALYAALREAFSLQQILDRLQARCARGGVPEENRELKMVIARTKTHYSQAVAFAAHARIALGRECLVAGIVPAGAEEFRAEAARLGEKLKGR
jgi:molecular chaperone DnaK